jgi:hypothetical protein
VYIYSVNTGAWQHHSSAPLAVKLLVYISFTALLFFLFHAAMMFTHDEEINNGTYSVATWVQELYFNIWVTLPAVLLVTGKSLQDKKRSKLLLAFCALFAVCHLLNIGNTYEWVDIRHLQYPSSIALLGILITWIIIVSKRRKTILDALKLLWLFGMIYSFIVPRFVPGGHEAGNFLVGSMLVFPFMMAVGFVNFFRKPNTVGHGT